MVAIDMHAQSVQAIVDMYASRRRKRPRPMSIKAAIRAIRLVLPHAQLSDAELTLTVIAAASRYCHEITFEAWGNDDCRGAGAGSGARLWDMHSPS